MCVFGPILHFFVKILHQLPKSTFSQDVRKVHFHGYKRSRKFANSRKFLPSALSTYTRYQCPKKPHNFKERRHALIHKMCFLIFFEFFNHLLAFSLVIIFGGRGRKKVANFFAFSSDKTFVIWPKFRNFCPLDL